jgi:suppressor of tumorigenicity protein 13
MQEKGDINMSDSGECYDSKRPIEDDDDDDIVESDIDLDNTDVVEPDNDPPQKVMESVC